MKIIPYRVLQPDKKTHWTSKIHKMLYWHSYIPVLCLVQEVASLSGKVPPPKLCCHPNPVTGGTCWYTYVLNTSTTHKQLLSPKASSIHVGKTSVEQRHSANDGSLSAWRKWQGRTCVSCEKLVRLVLWDPLQAVTVKPKQFRLFLMWADLTHFVFILLEWRLSIDGLFWSLW